MGQKTKRHTDKEINRQLESQRAKKEGIDVDIHELFYTKKNTQEM